MVQCWAGGWLCGVGDASERGASRDSGVFKLVGCGSSFGWCTTVADIVLGRLVRSVVGVGVHSWWPQCTACGSPG